jgi:anthranilate synthase component 1
MYITPHCTTITTDLTAPAAIYLRLRDKFSRVFLFDSSDYHGAGDCRSFICADPLAQVVVSDGKCSISRGKELDSESFNLNDSDGVVKALGRFMGGITIDPSVNSLPKGVAPGVFGYIAWSAIPYLERISFRNEPPEGFKIPELHFTLFRYVVACNPFKAEAYILENRVRDEQSDPNAHDLAEFIRAAFSGEPRPHAFKAVGSEQSLTSDEEFLKTIDTCKRHIKRGDVFQIVPSRRYLQRFEGDDFQVYRALRAINPSPYLFYCDFGGYRLFGSSPEAQISISNGRAGIYPIAGTYPRSGSDERDLESAERLASDPKENAEHCMLVDLARNDLSRHCNGVHVEAYRETHFFSHVIHLVSKVVGTLPKDSDLNSVLQVICDTFPIGTLSGAPKYRALEILDEIEPHGRGHYGGCIGFIGFNGDVVLGILIRSFLSINNTLAYQAGMGIVFDSDPASELDEGHNKLRALRAAIARAEGGMS